MMPSPFAAASLWDDCTAINHKERKYPYFGLQAVFDDVATFELDEVERANDEIRRRV